MAAPTSPLRTGPYWGYWVILAVFSQWVMATGIAFYSFSLFFPRWQAELGWSLTEINAAQSALALMALIGPVVGRLVDLRGPRIVLLASVPVMAAAIGLRGAMTELWHLWALTVLQAVGMATPWVASPKLIGLWFERTRGRMMGIALMGNNVGGLVIAPLAGVLIGAIGWRETFYLAGGVMLLINLPVAYLLIRDRPEQVAAELERTGRQWEFAAAVPGQGTGGRSVRGREGIGWSAAAALRTRAFWLVSLALLMGTVSMVSVVLQLGNHLQIVGIGVGAAGLVAGVMGGFGGVGKVLFGALTERFSSRYMVATCLGLQIAGLALLLQVSGPERWWLLAPFVVLYGTGFGAIGTLESLFAMELFGLASFGTIFGLLNAVTTAGQAVAPPVVGWTVDATGSYMPVFVVVLGLLAVGVAASLLARPPRRAGAQPEEVTAPARLGATRAR